ncbi:MAG: M48 family metalloprotease [Moraxella sp.]|nr:M48 family metalloprotease [Moraxella sp.]
MKRLTNFFAAQRYYRHMSHLYYGLFLAVAFVQFLLLFLLIGGASYLFTGKLGATVWLWLLVGLACYFVLGAMIARHKTKQGGISIAASAKAVRLFVYQGEEAASQDPVFAKSYIRVGDSRQLPAAYKRYYEFATQMSIASGVPLPMLYVLPFEQGVNGFVAGFEPSDMVMVLTQGALEKLSNAELYGLIGHEFGHILHGDARLNLRLYTLLNCLAWVYDLVDGLEGLLLGKFSASDYDDSPNWGEIGGGVGINSNSWDNYLASENRSRSQAEQEAETAAFLVVMPIMGVLLFLRLFGVLGMASAEWLKQQFNQQREYLADATSVQLTRAPDVVEALKALQAKYSTTLYNKTFSTCMSHFFFASPEIDEVKLGMHSHPLVLERINALRQRQFESFADEITAGMNEEALKQAHNYAINYIFVQPAEQSNHDNSNSNNPNANNPSTSNSNVNNSSSNNSNTNTKTANTAADSTAHDKPSKPSGDTDDIKVIEFEAFPETIVDGRLVVDGWLPTDEPVKYTLYPHQALSRTDIGDFIELRHMQGVELAWEISSRLTKLAEGLALLESVLLCRHYQEIDPNVMVGFAEVFCPTWHLADSRVLTQTDKAALIAPHTLPTTLLSEVSKMDRRLDSLIALIVIRQLGKQSHTGRSEYAAYAQRYASALVRLIHSYPTFEHTTAQIQTLAFDYRDVGHVRLTAGISPLYHASVILALLGVLNARDDKLLPIQIERCKQISAWLLGAVHDESMPKLVHQAMAVLLALICGVQDNSLAMRQYDKMLGAWVRWCRLLGVMADDLMTSQGKQQTEQDRDNKAWQVQLLYRVRALGVMDWLAILMIIGEYAPNKAVLVDTLMTAFIYDGELKQTEYDILCLLATAWNQPIPKVDI